MENRDWERKIKEKLERSSVTELGFPVDSEKLWQNIESTQNPKKFRLFPLMTHAAAVLVGILISGVVYLLFFNSETPRQSANIDSKAVVILEKKAPVKPAEQFNRDVLRKKDKVEKDISANKATYVLKKIERKSTKNIHPPENTFLKSQEAIVQTSKRQEQYSSSSFSETEDTDKTYQVNKNKTAGIAYWSEIQSYYKRQGETRGWTKIARKFQKREKDFYDSDPENQKAPALVFIQSFKQK